MATTVLRPDSVHSGAGNLIVTGAATAQAATSDNSDASYFRKLNSILGTGTAIIGFASTTISSSQKVRRVRLRGRLETPSSAGKLNLQLGTRVDGVNYFSSALAIRGLVAISEQTGQWYSTAPDGASWDQTRIDAARIQFTEYKDSTDRGFIYELYLDVDVATQGTVTVANPTGTITTTAVPDIEWSTSDPDGDVATYYQVKVFTSAQYTAAGFDPAVSTATWDSGVTLSSDTLTTVGTYLLNGAHRAYVRTAKTINGSPFWSAWAYSSFTVTLSPPTTPTLTKTYNSTQNSITLTATGAAAVGFDSQTFRIQRSDDNGVTWTTLRYGSALAPSGTYTASITDHEAKRGITVQYRARAVGVVGTNVRASAWSTPITQATTNAGTWIVKTVALAPVVVAGARVIGPDKFEIEEQVGTFRPLGRTYPVVLSQAIHGQDGTLRVVTIGSSEYDTIAPLLTYRGNLFVQDPFGQQRYIRVVKRSISRSGAASNPRYDIELGYLEVEG